jgi:hypothetical protein
MSLVDNIKAGFERIAREVSLLKNSTIVKDVGRPDVQTKYDSLPAGTLYQDKMSTDGAVIWLKTGVGKKWKVVSGDTGWVKLKKHASLATRSTIMTRRIGDMVFYSFGGGEWGWFGITKRGGAAFQPQTSYGNKGCRVITLNGIPDGFRSVTSTVGNIYKDATDVYGTIYVAGKGDSNFIALGFNTDIPTDKETLDIRVSSISYPTDDTWPQTNILRTQGFLY